jgi:hypothetical protein
LFLSAHFVKYVTTASYLEPKLAESEVIESITCHYLLRNTEAASEHKTKQYSKSIRNVGKPRIVRRKDNKFLLGKVHQSDKYKVNVGRLSQNTRILHFCTILLSVVFLN